MTGLDGDTTVGIQSAGGSIELEVHILSLLAGLV